MVEAKPWSPVPASKTRKVHGPAGAPAEPNGGSGSAPAAPTSRSAAPTGLSQQATPVEAAQQQLIQAAAAAGAQAGAALAQAATAAGGSAAAEGYTTATAVAAKAQREAVEVSNGARALAAALPAGAQGVIRAAQSLLLLRSSHPPALLQARGGELPPPSEASRTHPAFPAIHPFASPQSNRDALEAEFVRLYNASAAAQVGLSSVITTHQERGHWACGQHGPQSPDPALPLRANGAVGAALPTHQPRLPLLAPAAPAGRCRAGGGGQPAAGLAMAGSVRKFGGTQ